MRRVRLQEEMEETQMARVAASTRCTLCVFGRKLSRSPPTRRRQSAGIRRVVQAGRSMTFSVAQAVAHFQQLFSEICRGGEGAGFHGKIAHCLSVRRLPLEH